MERLSSKIHAFLEEKRQKQKKQEEAERQERVTNHSHKPDCSRAQDIDIKTTYAPNFPRGGAFDFDIPVVSDLETTCQECGSTQVEYPYQGFTEYREVTSGAELPPAVLAGIIGCVRAAFGETPADTAEHIQGDRILLRHEHGEVSGFTSTVFGSAHEVLNDPRFSKMPGAYFAAAAISNEHQGKGVYRQLNERRFAYAFEQRLPTIYTRTQNPIVEASLVRGLQEAKRQKKITNFSLERMICPKQYGKMLTTEQPRTKDRSLQAIYDQLDYASGDAYALIFHLEYPERSKR